MVVQLEEDTYQLKSFTVCTISLESFQQTQDIFSKAYFTVNNILFF